VKPDDAKEIVEATMVNHQPIARLLYLDPQTRKRCTGPSDIAFHQRQTRFVLKDCGLIDPEDPSEYMAGGGYDPARKAYLEMEPQAICELILKSGLRGRGGGGFPTGRKWEAARVQNSAKKYVICNGDEGDPGAFMDRRVMEGNPHSVLEGLMIAARAIGADEGYVYVRAEYPLAVRRMRKAVKDAVKADVLGNNVLGSHLKMWNDVMEGAGAFVCGEETAMIASIEGRRGMPAPKPHSPPKAV
jgi:NADH-quinone oxidoreductase subunit F